MNLVVISPSKFFGKARLHPVGKRTPLILRIQRGSTRKEKVRKFLRMYRGNAFVGNCASRQVRDTRYLSRTGFQKHVHVKIILEVVMQLDNIHVIQLFVDHNLTCDLQGIHRSLLHRIVFFPPEKFQTIIFYYAAI